VARVLEIIRADRRLIPPDKCREDEKETEGTEKKDCFPEIVH
jgi:hypothetical protein